MQMEFKEVVEFVFEIGLTLILRVVALYHLLGGI